MALTGIDIFKFLPKTNCGECGIPTCLAFAMKLAARQIELDPGACVVVEDAVVGVRGAKKAGMRAVGVTTTHAAEALQEADLVVESLLDISVDEIVHLLLD